MISLYNYQNVRIVKIGLTEIDGATMLWLIQLLRVADLCTWLPFESNWDFLLTHVRDFS